MRLNNSDIDKIKLPDNFDERIKNTVDKTYKQKNKKSKRGKKVAIAAGLAVAVSSGFMIANPEYVEAAIQKIREVFKTRNYNVVLEDGTEAYKGSYKVNHKGIEIEIEVETKAPGLLKITEKIDTSKIKEEDWKITDENFKLEANKAFYTDEHITDKEQDALYNKLWSGEDISKDIEVLKGKCKDNNDCKYGFVDQIEKARELYEWGISDEPFITKNMNLYLDYSIKGEYPISSSSTTIQATETYTESETIFRIPESVIGPKELELDINIDNINFDIPYPISVPEKKLTIPLKAAKGESAVKYIPINHSYTYEGMRDAVVQELIVYPDGRIELFYNFGSHKDKDYKITKFRLQNEDGTIIRDTGESGRMSMEEVVNWADVPWHRVYEGKITGDTVKIIPVVTHNTNKNIVVDEDEEILKEIKPIIVKVK